MDGSSSNNAVVEPGSERILLEVWSDVACPWCYVGRRNLQVVLADLDEPDRPDVRWRAYQLDPTIPADGAPADAYFERRFGADLPRLEQSREHLVALGEELGIAFRFDRQRTIANTHLAHRVLAAADDLGEREPVMDALFAANFERGIDIGDPDALRLVIAEQLEDDDLAARLVDRARSDSGLASRVDADIELAREIGISGVPCFVADRAIAIPGAVPPPVLGELLGEAAARRDAATGD
ncbi:MAG: DsbA family oxidoreductase [Thermoleophilia bacterium]|nr:DsbA family oxidoreductase [Thermoleophilia bacterium]